jgi:hypothetical protein
VINTTAHVLHLDAPDDKLCPPLEKVELLLRSRQLTVGFASDEYKLSGNNRGRR